jgi:uncharacterized protein YndB with AHSA1/START domain
MNPKSDAATEERTVSEADIALHLKRTFAAPIALVWRAWTESEFLRRWCYPPELSVFTSEHNFTPGCRLRCGMRDRDGIEIFLGGHYIEIVAPHTLVMTHAWEDGSGQCGPRTHITLQLREENGQTVTEFQQVGFTTHYSKLGHEKAWSDAFDLLTVLLDRIVKHKTYPLVVRRHFDAPAELVFDAWLDPHAIGRWLFATPNGEMVWTAVDPREGGEFTVIERRGDVMAEHFGQYLEIDRPRRLVFHFRTSVEQAFSRVTVDIRPSVSGCELVLTHELDLEWLDYVDRVQGGWAMILHSLADVVES